MLSTGERLLYTFERVAVVAAFAALVYLLCGSVVIFLFVVIALRAWDESRYEV